MIKAAFPESILYKKIVKSLKLIPNFITKNEIDIIYNEINSKLLKMPYLNNHWDQKIIKYREFEKEHWNKNILPIFAKQYLKIFEPNKLEILSKIHIVDLHPEGYVNSHVDSIESVGKIVSGICLKGEFLFRFKPLENLNEWVDFLISPGSLFAMTDFARYNCTHEIEKNNNSFIKKRVVLVMMRDIPLK